MENISKTIITVEVIVKAPVEKVWEYFTAPSHVTQWNHASDDWHSPRAENDLRKGGRFSFRMEAKDGSFGFDFSGVYGEVVEEKHIQYTIGDGRMVSIDFNALGNETRVRESFEAEGTHSEEMQRAGWQAILDNFKKYVETH